MKQLFAIFIVHLLVSLFPSEIVAQKPSAILVMLKAERNRITSLTKNGPATQLAGITSDAALVRQKTINDFSDNFNFCPVYYFMDTNLHLIKEKKFESVLFDKDRKMYHVSPIEIPDTSFFIVFYGTEFSRIIQGKNNEQTYRSPSPNSRPLKGLWIFDHNFKKNEHPVISFINRREPKKPINNTYEFISGNFDISYMKSAERLDNKFEEHYPSK